MCINVDTPVDAVANLDARDLEELERRSRTPRLRATPESEPAAIQEKTHFSIILLLSVTLGECKTSPHRSQGVCAARWAIVSTVVAANPERALSEMVLTLSGIPASKKPGMDPHFQLYTKTSDCFNHNSAKV